MTTDRDLIRVGVSLAREVISVGVSLAREVIPVGISLARDIVPVQLHGSAFPPLNPPAEGWALDFSDPARGGLIALIFEDF